MHNSSKWKVIFVFSFLTLICPLMAVAGLVPLTTGQMSDIDGRHGIEVSTEGIRFDTRFDNLYYMDADGTGTGDKAGYLSLCNVILVGGVDFHSPVRVAVETGPNAFSREPVTSVNLDIDGMTLEVDRFSIDAIRVGSAPGEGPSFGAVEISNMRTVISGKISIWAH